MRNLKDNKFIRIIFAPYIILRARIVMERFKKSRDSDFILQFKGKYEGKRCFIIGNGPSLTGNDLDLIKGELSFACNRIYNIFPQTTWRPDFWMCLDPECLIEEFENIKKMQGPVKFIGAIGKKYSIKKEDQLHKAVVYDSRFILDRRKHIKKSISTKCHEYFSPSSTVTCQEIEFAIYMGFKEIYLLGVDHSCPITIDKNGKKVVDHSIKDHFEGGGSADSSLHYIYVDAATQCYQVYRDYADIHNIHIYNATRGGKLEVFERVKLEDVKNKQQ